MLQLCALATAVLHIRPVKELSYPADYPETFLFCLANVFGIGHSILHYAEIRFVWVNGEEAAKRMAGRDVLRHSVKAILYCVATIYSGLLFYSDLGEKGTVYHTPMAITLIAWLLDPVLTYFLYIVFGGNGDIKSRSVPMNIDFVIHRYGEWTMLMLGESVLSLLIVNDSSASKGREFYTTFYVGMVSVILLQYLYFKSQPHSPDRHAMRRSRNAGICFSFANQIYSASLILVGVSYKLISTEYSSEYDTVDYETEGGDGHRLLGGSSSSYPEKLSTSERQSRIATLFGLALGVVFITLDIMIIAHNGFASSRDRCYCKAGKVQYIGIFVVVISRVLICAFIMTLSQYYYTPHVVAWLGLGTIVMQVSVRFLGKIYFPTKMVVHVVNGVKHKISLHSEESSEVWPNVTRPTVTQPCSVQVYLENEVEG